jgi:LPS-assembly lipoprotein
VARRALAVTLLILGGAGCGFHLRGAGADATVGAVYVAVARGVPLARELERALAQPPNRVVDVRSEAELVADLAEQIESRRTVSVTDRGRSAEYELEIALRFSVLAPDGAELVPERTIAARRTYRIDRANLAATEQEEALLRRELTLDLVQQVVRSLGAAARSRAAAGA